MSNENKTENLRFLLLASLFWASTGFIIPYFAPYASSYGISATVIGFMSSLYGLAQLLLRVPMGMLGDRYHCLKLFMMTGLLAQIMCAVLCFYPCEINFFLSKFCSGVCVATWVAYSVYFMEMNKGTDARKATSLLSVANNLGTLLGFSTGGLLMSRFGFSSLLWATAAAAFLGLILVCGLKKHDYEFSPRPFGEYLRPLGDKRLLAASAVSAVMMLMVKGTSASFTGSYVLSIGGTQLQVGLINTVLSASAFAVSLFLISRYAQKIAGTTLLSVAFILGGLASVCIGFTSSPVIVLLMQAALGLTQGAVLAISMAMAVGHVPAQNKTTAMGVYQSLYSLGITLGPIITGSLIDAFGSYRPAYTLTGLLALPALALIAWEKSLIRRDIG